MRFRAEWIDAWLESSATRARRQRPPASKLEAIAWRDRLRTEITDGTFVDPKKPPIVAPGLSLTFDDVSGRYLTAYVGKVVTRHGQVQWSGRYLRPKSALQAEYHLNTLRRTEVPAANGNTVRFGSKPIDGITKADVEAIREVRRPYGPIGCNRPFARLRHLFNWAIAEGFIERTPFERGGVSVIKLETRAEHFRQRRLAPGEEIALLAHAGPHLRALIVAALSTGCRRGELLSLQWSQIRRDDHGDAKWIALPAAKTKTNQARTIPIGPRLRAELAMRQPSPDGTDHPGDAYVFGNEVGEQIDSSKTAWVATCRRAGVSGLRFHDLRREFACRLLESGAEQHDVRDFLGHANITTTSRYLASTPIRLERALARMEDALRTGFAQSAEPPESPESELAAKSLN
jgi:integrase